VKIVGHRQYDKVTGGYKEKADSLRQNPAIPGRQSALQPGVLFSRVTQLMTVTLRRSRRIYKAGILDALYLKQIRVWTLETTAKNRQRVYAANRIASTKEIKDILLCDLAGTKNCPTTFISRKYRRR